jgi:hypothetical protein
MAIFMAICSGQRCRHHDAEHQVLLLCSSVKKKWYYHDIAFTWPEMRGFHWHIERPDEVLSILAFD